MRRIGSLVCCITVLLALAGPVRAEEQEGKDASPSLEYRPPKPTLPEPRQPTPAPPVTIFRETIGRFGISTGAFDHPVDVTIDNEGNLYVLDAGNNRVQKFDRFGNFVTAWGTHGSRKGEFKNPRAIAMDPDGFLYVVDSGNHRIQKFCTAEKSCAGDKLYAFVMSWGSLGSRSGDFKNPLDITFDATGNNYVLDAGNERVQNFDAAGRFLGEWGSAFSSRGGGKFTDLVSIAWSEERFGYLYLLGGDGCTVQQFETDGTLRRSWSAAAPETDLCVPSQIQMDNREDILYVLDAGNGLLARFTRDGRYLTALRGADRVFQKPEGFSVNQERGEIAVADTGNNVVQKFTIR